MSNTTSDRHALRIDQEAAEWAEWARHHQGVVARERIEELERENAHLRTERDQARTWLHQFGEHAEDCKSIIAPGYWAVRRCDCGLREALVATFTEMVSNE